MDGLRSGFGHSAAAAKCFQPWSLMASTIGVGMFFVDKDIMYGGMVEIGTIFELNYLFFVMPTRRATVRCTFSLARGLTGTSKNALKLKWKMIKQHTRMPLSSAQTELL